MGERRRLAGLVAALIVSMSLLALAVSPAAASDVQRANGELEIDGDPDDDAITLSSDGTTLTITDTGTGGVTTADPDCTQVNATTVTCPILVMGDPRPVIEFEVDLDNGTDSFTNTNFEAEEGEVFAFGNTGSKTIAAGPGPQFVGGGVDDDSLDGGPGDDIVLDGSDAVSPDPTAGNDLLVGGPGEDWTQYFRTTPVAISLDGQANDGAAGETDNVQVENVSTGNGNDAITGDDARNLLVGLGGDDVIRGLGGDDLLYGEFPNDVGLIPNRGFGATSGNDTLDGGAGADELECGGGFDLALRDPLDDVRGDCERVGAGLAGDSAKVRGKRKRQRFKVSVSCPAAELKACRGKLVASAAGKRLARGKFSVPNGQTKKAAVKLTKKGKRTLRRARGSLLVTVEATTNEPGGVSVDSARILIHR